MTAADRWADVPERVQPSARPQTNPDRQASADPVWGHTGVTKRTIMAWIAEQEGKLPLLMRHRADSWDHDDASEYFIQTREKAEHLIKSLRNAGVPIGWTT